MNEDILFNDGFDAYVGNTLAVIVDVFLAVSHWVALILACFAAVWFADIKDSCYNYSS